MANVLFKTFNDDETSQRAAENAIWFLIGCLDFCTARIYGCSVRTTRIYGPYTYGPYIRAVRTEHPYIRPVYTARTKKAFLAMHFDCTARIYGWCVLSSRIYGPYKSLNDQSETR